MKRKKNTGTILYNLMVQIKMCTAQGIKLLLEKLNSCDQSFSLYL